MKLRDGRIILFCKEEKNMRNKRHSIPENNRMISNLLKENKNHKDSLKYAYAIEHMTEYDENLVAAVKGICGVVRRIRNDIKVK